MKKLRREDFVVGQEVALVHMVMGRNEEPSIVPAKVTSIGRKHLTVAPEGSPWEYQFDMTDMFRQKTGTAREYYLFLDMYDARQFIQRREAIMRLRRFTQWEDLDDDEIKAIDRIVSQRRGGLYCAMAATDSYIWVAHDSTEEGAKEALVRQYFEFFNRPDNEEDSDVLTVEEFEEEFDIEVFPVIPGHGAEKEL